VRGASQGEGLGNQFLANIREADAICLVTRAFADPDVVHVEGRVDPKDDIETVTTELVLADVQTLEKQIPRLTKEVTGKKTPKEVLETAKAALELLEKGKVLSAHGTDLDPAILRGFGLMTTKKFIYVFNTDDAGLADEAMQAELRDFVAPAEAIFLDAKFEAELVELEPEEAREMLEASGQDEAGLDKLARVGFDTLGLQTYLTAGEKESRAWTIHKGWTAPQAAGVIHTDFERGFIKAEIVSYDDLVEYGSLAEAGNISYQLVVAREDAGAFAFIEGWADAAAIDDKPVGAFGAWGSFSFYPTKNMTSLEGGMVTTGDAALARRVRLLRNQGMDRQYANELVGLNNRMTDVAAAVGRVQLGRLAGWTAQRQANAAALNEDVMACAHL